MKRIKNFIDYTKYQKNSNDPKPKLCFTTNSRNEVVCIGGIIGRSWATQPGFMKVGKKEIAIPSDFNLRGELKTINVCVHGKFAFFVCEDGDDVNMGVYVFDEDRWSSFDLSGSVYGILVNRRGIFCVHNGSITVIDLALSMYFYVIDFSYFKNIK